MSLKRSRHSSIFAASPSVGFAFAVFAALPFVLKRFWCSRMRSDSVSVFASRSPHCDSPEVKYVVVFRTGLPGREYCPGRLGRDFLVALFPALLVPMVHSIGFTGQVVGGVTAPLAPASSATVHR